MTTAPVTAACLGGACELCPGVSNTGTRCECRCHGVPVMTSASPVDRDRAEPPARYIEARLPATLFACLECGSYVFDRTDHDYHHEAHS